MIQKILITGGAGFIGSHTVDVLLNQDKQVIVLDNLLSGQLTNLNMQHPNLEFVEGDVLEYPLLFDLLKDCDAVLHLAAISSVPQSMENPIYSFQVNTQGFLHVLEAVRKKGQKTRLIYASSAAVYGEIKELPCSDIKPLTGTPLSPYALQKIHIEDYAKLYSQLYGIESLGLRYFNVYGKRQDPHSPYSGVISRFLERYRQDSELTIYGDGLQSRDFIQVSDVAKANALALESQYAGMLNIATGEPQTLLQLIECIEKAGQKPAKIRFEEARQGDIKASYATTELAEEKLKFRASIPLQEGVKSLISDGT